MSLSGKHALFGRHYIYYNYHQGKRRKLEYMEKGNKYHKEKSTSKISLLHMREVEETKDNKLARFYSSQLIHIYNREFS